MINDAILEEAEVAFKQQVWPLFQGKDKKYCVDLKQYICMVSTYFTWRADEVLPSNEVNELSMLVGLKCNPSQLPSHLKVISCDVSDEFAALVRTDVGLYEHSWRQQIMGDGLRCTRFQMQAECVTDANVTLNHYMKAVNAAQHRKAGSTYCIPAGRPSGLVNPGQSCWLNACLQVLRVCYKSMPEMLACTPTSSLEKVLLGIHKISDLKALEKYLSECKFQSPRTGMQQDAAEGLSHLMALLPTETEAKFRSMWTESLTCQQCSHKSHTSDVSMNMCFLDVMMAPGKEATTLNDSWTNFINGRTDWKCTKCNHQGDGSCPQLRHMTHQPQLLVLILKKFDQSLNKLNHKLEIPQTLQLSSKCGTFELHGCISHHGHSMQAGHYTSHVRADGLQCGGWVHCNDKKTPTPVTVPDLQDAYILLYKPKAAAVEALTTEEDAAFNVFESETDSSNSDNSGLCNVVQQKEKAIQVSA